MPTYEYECQSCHERVEAVQRFTDPALTLCTHCGGELRKVFSAVGVVFKGSGFYKNDSRSPDKSSTPTATTPASTPSTESSTTPAPTTAPATATTSSATSSD
jgi:putative FmdB family regulatory protein